MRAWAGSPLLPATGIRNKQLNGGLGSVYVGRSARVVCVCVLFVFVCNIVVGSALRQDQTKRASTQSERTHAPPSKSKATRASEIVDGQSVQLG
jgi:hypothetical protein